MTLRPDGEKALELLKRNLQELQIERADLVYAHSIGDDKMDLKTVLGPQGVMQALEQARQDGLCRFVGISGHNRPAKFLKVMEEVELDVMMPAVNPVIRHVYNFEERVWSEAHRSPKPLSAEQQQQVLAEAKRLADDGGEVHGPVSWDR